MQTMGPTAVLPAVPHGALLLHLLQQHHRDHAVGGFPGERAFWCAALAIRTRWTIFNVAGVAKQGPGHYFMNSVWPPDVPFLIKAILVAPIEFVSVFIVRPFSLAVRLFANMLAGHLILTTFSILCAALFVSRSPS